MIRRPHLVWPATLMLAAASFAAEPDGPPPPTAFPAGTRTVAVRFTARATAPCDTFVVAVLITSGMAAPEKADGRIDVVVDHIQDALRTAPLPLMELDPAASPRAPETGGGGRQAAYRSYRVVAASLAQARAVQETLAPFTIANSITDAASVFKSDLRASSARVTAAPEAYRTAARTQALASGRDEAEQNAKALGLKLGKPLAIGVVDVYAIDADAEQGFAAQGWAVFEMTE